MKNLHPKKVHFIFHLIIVLFITFSIKSTTGQSNIDSLLNLLEHSPEEEKAAIMNQISDCYSDTSQIKSLRYALTAYELATLYKNYPELFKSLQSVIKRYRGISEYDSALTYANNALNLYEKLDSINAKGRIYLSKSQLYYDKGDMDSTLANLNKAFNILEAGSDYRSLIKIFNIYGLVAFEQGEYSKATEYYYKSLDLCNEKSYTEDMASIYNNLAMVYADWQKYDEALKCLMNAYELFHEKKDFINEGTTLSNIGFIYSQLQNYEEALKYIRKAINLNSSIGNKRSLALALGELGRTFWNNGNRDSSLIYIQQALDICNDIDAKSLSIVFIENLGYAFKEMGNYQKALEYFSLSHSIAIELGLTQRYLGNYANFYELYLIQKNYPKALEYYKKYSELKDSLFTEEKHKQIAELETKYETEKHIEQNKLLESENKVQSLQLKKNRAFLYSIVIISILGVLLFTIIFYSYRRRQKSKQLILQKESELKISEMEKKVYSTEVEVQEKERKRFAKELHDGLGPLLSSLKLYINKITGSESSELVMTTKEILNEAITNTRNIAYDIMPIAVAEQDLIDSVNKFIFRIKKTSSINFTVNSEKELPKFNQPEKLVLYRVITELINNTIKHANADKVTISIDIVDSVNEIRYSDNGKGFDKENIKAGLGIKNITDNIKSIGGEIEIEGKEGEGMEAIIRLKSKF